MPNRSHVSEYEPVTRSGGNKSLWQESSEVAWLDPETVPVLDIEERRNSIEPPALSKAKRGKRQDQWITKHGHTISYIGLFLFTTVLLFRPYELFPSLAFLSSSAFWLAILTLGAFFPSQLGLEGNLTARPREVNLILLLCLTALLSMPLAISPGLAWDTFFNKEFIRAVLMFLVLVNVVRTERRLKLLLFLAVGVSCYLSERALNDYLSGRFVNVEGRIGGALGGMFGNPNDMAIHLVTVVPITVALLLGARGVLKLVYAACFLLMVSAIIVTFSRGGFLGLIFASVVLAWKLGRRNRLLMIVVTSVILVLFTTLAPGNYALRIASIFIPSLDPVGSSSARSELLKLSIKVALTHPLFGIGMGNFNILSIHDQVSHNSYTQVASEMGLTAMVIYIMFMISPIRRLRQMEREIFTSGLKERRLYYLAVGLQASIIGYMACSFFGAVAYQFYVYYLVGYAVCLRRIYHLEIESREKVTPTKIEQPAI